MNRFEFQYTTLILKFWAPFRSNSPLHISNWKLWSRRNLYLSWLFLTLYVVFSCPFFSIFSSLASLHYQGWRVVHVTCSRRITSRYPLFTPSAPTFGYWSVDSDKQSIWDDDDLSACPCFCFDFKWLGDSFCFAFFSKVTFQSTKAQFDWDIFRFKWCLFTHILTRVTLGHC